MAKSDLTAQRLREVLTYDSAIGVFRRREGRLKGAVAGQKTGMLSNARKYVSISVDGAQYLGHRLAWLHFYGRMPTLVDHIDGNGKNNAIHNLREVTQQVNSQNIKTARNNNKSGLLGVSWNRKAARWHTAIRVGALRVWIGAFTDKHEAHARYLDVKRRLHEGCTI